MNSYRSRATKRLGSTLPGVAARDPGSYDLPDFRTLGDGPYPPILLEAMERAGNRFERWNEQVELAGYCCRPIRLRGKVEQIDKARVCPHGARSGCSVRHAEGDPVIGTPLCQECLDHEGQVVWNAMAPKLWHRTWTYFSRELAAVMGMTHAQVLSLVKPRMVKVAEYQRRGASHLHAIIRLDTAAPEDAPEAVAPPPQ